MSAKKFLEEQGYNPFEWKAWDPAILISLMQDYAKSILPDVPVPKRREGEKQIMGNPFDRDKAKFLHGFRACRQQALNNINDEG